MTDDPGIPAFLTKPQPCGEFWDTDPTPRIHKGAWLAAGAVLAVIVVGIWSLCSG